MKKNHKVILFVFLAFLVAILVLLLASLNSTSSPLPAVIDTVDGVDGPTVAAQEEERAKLIDHIFKSKNMPIRFKGIVVDQDGMPVAGAEVQYQVRNARLNAGQLSNGFVASTVQSGTDGTFDVSGQVGYLLSIDRIVKEGYRFAARQSLNFSGAEMDNSSVRQYILISEETLGLPLFFRAHKFKTEWKGEPIGLDLRMGISEASVDLVIIPIRYGEASMIDEWKFTVIVSGGGVIEAPVGNRSIAPLDGYRSEWSVGYSRDDGEFLLSLTKELFVRLRDGSYARLHLSLMPDLVRVNETPSIVVRVFINESGSRVLEDGTTESRY